MPPLPLYQNVKLPFRNQKGKREGQRERETLIDRDRDRDIDRDRDREKYRDRGKYMLYNIAVSTVLA